MTDMKSCAHGYASPPSSPFCADCGERLPTRNLRQRLAAIDRRWVALGGLGIVALTLLIGWQGFGWFQPPTGLHDPQNLERQLREELDDVYQYEGITTRVDDLNCTNRSGGRFHCDVSYYNCGPGVGFGLIDGRREVLEVAASEDAIAYWDIVRVRKPC